MILVLAEAGDAGALWLAGRLAARQRVRVVTPTQLVCSRSFSHRLGGDDDGFTVALADGEQLSDGTVQGVINRVVGVPDVHLQRAAAGDRAYAQAELWAFLLGWIAGLACPVLNPADASGLSGAWRPPREADALAALAGLPLAAGELPPPETSPPPVSVFVLDGRIIGRPLPVALRDAVLRFAGLWGTRLLQLDFEGPPGARVFRSATSFVDFPRGGDLLADQIARTMAA